MKQFGRLCLPQITPSLAISILALVVALTGTAYAAGVLPKNSVGTPQLKKNAVISAKVKNGSLLKADLKSGQLPAGPQRPAGPQGAAGPEGPQGAAGSAKGWATINGTGTIYLLGGSLGAPTVTHPATGIHCISGNDWPQQGGAYALSLVGSDGQITINPYFSGSVCNQAGYFVAVNTSDASGVAADKSFTIPKLS